MLLCIVYLWVYYIMLLWIIVCLWMGIIGSVVLFRSNSFWEVVWSRGLVYILLVFRVILGYMIFGWNRWCWLLLGGLLYSSRVLIRWLGWGILERWLGWNSIFRWFRFWDIIFNMMFMVYFKFFFLIFKKNRLVKMFIYVCCMYYIKYKRVCLYFF